MQAYFNFESLQQNLKNLKGLGITKNLADVLLQNEPETIKHCFNFIYYFIPNQKILVNGAIVYPYLHNKILKEIEKDEYLDIAILATYEVKNELLSVLNNSTKFYEIVKKASNYSKKLCYKELNFKKFADFNAFQNLQEKEDKKTQKEFENALFNSDFERLLKVLSDKQKKALIKKLNFGGKLHSNYKQIIQKKAKKIWEK